MKIESTRRFLRSASILAIVLAPALFVATQIPDHYTRVPFQDEWSLGPRLAKDSLTIQDFFRQHNEHRHLIPMFGLTVIAKMTGWSQRYELALNVVFALFNLCLIVAIGRRKGSDLGVTDLALGFLTSVFLFSPTQFDVWLWPWMVVSTMTVTLLCAAALLLSRGGRAAFVLALVSTVAASFCSAQGLFIWIALVPLAAWNAKDGQLHLKRLAVWAGAGIFTWLVYFQGYVPRGETAPLANVVGHPLRFVEFVLAAAGAPWLRIEALAKPIGFIQIALFVWLAVSLLRSRVDVPRTLACVGIGLWALLFAAASGAGRLEYGIGTALTSRYLASTAILPAAFFALVAISMERRRDGSLQAAVGALVIGCLSWVNSYVATRQTWDDILLERRRGVACLEISRLTNVRDNRCLEILFPNPQSMLDVVKQMETANIRRFRKPDRLPMVTDEWAGRISPRERRIEDDRVELSGLIIDPDEKPNLGLVLLDVGGPKLWCCGFSGAEHLRVPTEDGSRPVRVWSASVPEQVLPRDRGIVAWALLEDPDRLVRLTGTVPVRTDDQTVYSASQRDER